MNLVDLGRHLRERRENCPVCRSEMVLRRNNYTGELFWGCKGFVNGCGGPSARPLKVRDFKSKPLRTAKRVRV